MSWETSKKEVVWTKVHADLVGNFSSFSESKCTETSLAAIQHFVSDSSHVHCTVLDMRTYTYMPPACVHST